MESLKQYAELCKLNPAQILRNLENGFFMSHAEQTEAADYIRQLQQSNEVLKQGMIEFADTIFKLRQVNGKMEK